jgi:predicted ABC-type ATPase
MPSVERARPKVVRKRRQVPFAGEFIFWRTMAPSVVILGGPNGAGKSTAARTLLAELLQIRTFVNADVIAQGLSGFDPEASALEAGRIMLKRLHSLAEERADFAFESTLAGKYYAKWLRLLKEVEYHIHLVYFWLASADLAVQRVAERVKMGGHDVPEAVVRQRYERSLRNFIHLYLPLATTWEVYDNSNPVGYDLVAFREHQESEIMILNEAVWDKIQEGAS